MATKKNITMKQFNGTDYDTLYPKTVAAQIDDVYSKDETYPKSQLYIQQQILADSTKTMFGLGTDAVPDDMWVNLVPVGGILWYAKDGIPNGYLKCDGSVISRVDYKRLFDVIGTAFGAGNGRTTFALPDLRAKFIRGAGNNGSYAATFGNTQEATCLNSQEPSGFYGTTNADIETYSDQMLAGNYYSTVNGRKRYSYVRPYNIALTPIIKY